ncbi:MAG: ferrous iron transport protein B [Candidatus Nanopelagicales bacterium]
MTTTPDRSAPSCHQSASDLREYPGAPVIALVGSPNSGKSSLFNALTGIRRDVGNWPGTSVEVGRGTMAWPDPADADARAVVLDFPGAYGLDPVSPDEALTRDLLIGVPESERPDVVVVTVDACSLGRSLYLVAQLRETSARLVLAVTMADVAARRGITIDADELARATGAGVVVLDPRRGAGAVSAAIVAAATAPPPHPLPVAAPPDDDLALEDARFAWITAVADGCVTDSGVSRRTWSDRIDSLATAPVVGPVLFLAVMWVVFQVTTTVAAPLQEALDTLVSGPLSAGAQTVLDRVGLGDTWVAGLVIDGLIAGVGMLLTFVPLMALMFVLLALLEDSGYMARAAVVTDSLMRRIGLPGRAFLPLIVGFGCNVPAVAGTRVLSDSRHRLLTVLLVPFTSCTARLTVYVLVATTFFGSAAGTVVFGMYVVSILLVVLVGLLLRGTLIRSMGADPLVIDLPPYHRPHPSVVVTVTWVRLKGFLRTAGGIIVATVVAVWILSSIPVGGTGSFGNTPVSDSAFAAVSRTVAPVFTPAGFGDWQIASGLVTGFVAKEAVISTWAQTFALEAPSEADQPGALGDALDRQFTITSGGHPAAAALAFLIFLLAYTPCVATLAAQKREIGTRWTLAGVAIQLTIAWLLAVATFQVLRVLW